MSATRGKPLQWTFIWIELLSDQAKVPYTAKLPYDLILLCIDIVIRQDI